MPVIYTCDGCGKVTKEDGLEEVKVVFSGDEVAKDYEIKGGAWVHRDQTKIIVSQVCFSCRKEIWSIITRSSDIKIYKVTKTTDE